MFGFSLFRNNNGFSDFARVLLGLSLCWLTTQPVWAWNKQGHEWIVQAAAAELSAADLAKFDALLKEGIVVPPNYYHAKVGERLGAVSAWVDAIRDDKLAAVFKKYGSGVVPQVLQNYAQQNTSDWHYSNSIFVNERGGVYEGKCKFKQSGNLLKVWPNLLQAFKQAATPRDKNIVLGLALHFAADAYQPLHMMSAIDNKCESDRGGNGRCLMFKADGKACETNLHQVWDEGFGNFEQAPSWYKKQHPTNIFTFNDALKLAKDNTLVVYANSEAEFKSDAYLQHARELAATQADYAVGHTLFVLKYFLTQ